MSSISVLSLSLAVALASLTPACSSSSGSGPGDGDGGTGSSGGQPTPNYCGLVSVADAVALTGAPVTHIIPTSSGLGCDYIFGEPGNPDPNTFPGFALLFITKNAAAAYDAGKQPHPDYVPSDLPGVGDSAVSIALPKNESEVVVLKGSTTLLITGAQSPTVPLSLESETKLAKAIVAKLN